MALKKLPGSLWKHPKTGGWYWQVRKPGEKKRRSFPMRLVGQRYATKVKSLAQARQRHLWKQWMGPLGAPVRTIETWILDFQDWNRNTAAEPQVRYNGWIVRQFASSQGIREPMDITPEAIQDYITARREGTLGDDGGAEPKRRASQRTLVAHRNALGKFCRFLMLRRQTDHNPARLIELRQPSKRPPRYLTDRQISRLLKQTKKIGPPWMYLAVCVGLYEGLRRGEIAELTWADIGTDGMVVHAGKTADWRTVPIFPEMGAVLESTPRGDDAEYVFPRHNPRWWGELLSRITEQLPVFLDAEKQWSLLRNTFAVQRARGVGMNRPATVWELLAWLGHKNPTTTMRYVNIARAARSL